jgi:hypothetical protein
VTRRSESRDQLAREFAAIARRLGAAPRERDLPRQLAVQLRARFGSIDAARRAAAIAPRSRARVWSRERVIAEVRRLSRRGLPIRCRDLVDAGHHPLVLALYRYIGSILRTRILARVPEPPRRKGEREAWDEDRVVEEILLLADERRPLAYSKVDPRLIAAAVRYFGSWQVALEVAGFDYDSVRLTRGAYSEEELVRLLRRLAREEPDLTIGELHHRSYAMAFKRTFGSVEAAVRAAGLSSWPARLVQPRLSRRELVARLRARRRLGLPVYRSAIVDADSRVYSSAIAHYGSWAAALRAAGVKSDSPKQRRWSRALVLERLRARQASGRSLRPTDVQREDGSLYTQANQYFGSYRLAARQLGVDTRKRKWTKAMVLRDLRALARGRSRLIQEKVPPALVAAARQKFGKFAFACGAAGLEVHSKRSWTPALVVRELRAVAARGPVTKASSGHALYHACRQAFGSLSAACTAAGLRI